MGRAKKGLFTQEPDVSLKLILEQFPELLKEVNLESSLSEEVFMDETECLNFKQDHSSIEKELATGLKCTICLGITQLPSRMCNTCSAVFCTACISKANQ